MKKIKKMNYISMLCCSCFLMLWGCTQPTALLKHDQPLDVPPVVRVQPSPGSIWPGESASNMLFADRRARYLNDIVTILIEESSSGKNNTKTDTSRDTSTLSGIDAMLGLDTSLLKQFPTMGTKLSVGGTSANSLKGKGETQRIGALNATMSARVVRVLDNGNLVIEGRRQVTVNAEDQYIVLTGLVRPEDVGSDNVVRSRYIADARIVYSGNGVSSDKMRPGWMTRVLDWAWPF